MGKFWPVFLAIMQYSCGFYIFKKPVLSGCGPLISCLMVMMSLFLILLDINLYPNTLRKLWKIGHYAAEYLIAVFLTEHLMGNFWFPLEIAILAMLPKMANSLEDTLLSADFTCETICEILKMEITGLFFSYLLSFLLLIASLHATRKIDLRLLDSGLMCFLTDALVRLRRFGNQIYKKLPFAAYKNLKRDKRKAHFQPDGDADNECFTGLDTSDHANFPVVNEEYFYNIAKF